MKLFCFRACFALGGIVLFVVLWSLALEKSVWAEHFDLTRPPLEYIQDGPQKEQDLPHWQRLLQKEGADPSFGRNGASKLAPGMAAEWQSLYPKLSTLSLLEKARTVTYFFNKKRYASDSVIWGAEDYWSTPQEFSRYGGDCEDYAIAKYFALRSLGVPAAAMRLMALRDTRLKIWHAVLAVQANNEVYLLDNSNNLLLPHRLLLHYIPIYTVNEERFWVHVKTLPRAIKH